MESDGVSTAATARLYVESRGGRAGMSPEPRRARGPMTAVEVEHDETFPAPVTDPGGRAQQQTWRAWSVDRIGRRDGLWFYERHEGEGSPWSVTYLPTGQVRDGFTSLDDAREATAGTLLNELRTESVGLALDSADTAVRLAGQQILAVHVRIAGGTAVDAGCACGGLLAEARADGTMAHVDACPACQPLGALTITSPCPAAETGERHQFCADPRPVLTEAEQQMLALEQKQWRRTSDKDAAIREQFGMGPIRYYQLLRRLIERREALEHSPVLVNRLRRLRWGRS
jgi:hypothetical protein